jgi:hypothetical protein
MQMKSPAIFFSTVSIFILIIVGLFFSLTEIFQFFSNKDNTSLKKIISSKPKNIKGKQVLIESGINTFGDFTFFDTLDDPSMKKYIGLNGSMVLLKKEDYNRSGDLILSAKRITATSTTLTTPRSSSISPEIDFKNPKKKNPPTRGFVLQVGSFQDFQRADILKNKLAKYEYPVFISSTFLKNNEQTIHRVLVGTFSRKKDAEKVAIEIKRSEKTELLIKFYENKK